MTLKEFVANHPDHENQNIQEVSDLIKNDPDLPDTDDIEKICEHIYLKLDHEQTKSFMNLIMMWKFVENNYEQPDDPDLLTKINKVVDLQNSDPNYPY